MHSIRSVGSAGGSAEYFAKDDYYTSAETGDASEWGGSGAEELGLQGSVTKEDFEAILNGKLPNGDQVGRPGSRRFGLDMTFSMSKSASLIAYVAGDKSVLDIHGAAVKETMGWVEKNLAETRTYERNKKGDPVATGNLVYALFQHDTSRKMDPQGHIHAVVANVTKAPNGKWQSVHNDSLWKSNALIGAVYHSLFREKLEEAGYKTTITGKHGQFEIDGVDKAVMNAFSQRRQEIVREVAARGASTPEAVNAITRATRSAKDNSIPRDQLISQWRARANEMGWNGRAIIAEAQTRAKGIATNSQSKFSETVDRMREFLSRRSDPLVDAKAGGPIQAQRAVASAIRHHSEREAVFSRNDLLKSALDQGRLGVSVTDIEARIDDLQKDGRLIPEQATRVDGKVERYTTPEELKREHSINNHVQQGKGQAERIAGLNEVMDLLRSASDVKLLPEQTTASALALSSKDKIVAIQGRAGAGKSTMLEAMSRVAEQKGFKVQGLAVQNKMVADLAEGAKIDAQSISSFVNQHMNPSQNGADPDLSKTIILVDESSMVSNKQMLDIMEIAQKGDAARLVLVGDRKQLLPVEAGKAFSVMQDRGAPTATLKTNLRQQTPLLRAVADLAGRGEPTLALTALGNKVKEAEEPAVAAAEAWLSLSKEDRSKTSLLASGREARATINEMVQDGLRSSGELGSKNIQISTFQNSNLTREELRLSSSYRPGMMLIAPRTVSELRLRKGSYSVLSVDKNGRVKLTNGKREKTINPEKLKPDGKNTPFELGHSKSLQLHEKDKIRWGSNDKGRGIHGSALASIVSINGSKITVKVADGRTVSMDRSDPQLARIDLGYALNAHMAQGITRDNVIASMNSYERHLSNQRLFNVSVTRERQDFTLFTDNATKLANAMERNAGDKTSAIEATEPRKEMTPQAKDNGALARSQGGQSKQSDRSLGSSVNQPAKPPIDNQKTQELNL